MRPVKKEIIEIDVEPAVVGHDEMHGRLMTREIANEDCLRAKVREFMLDELCEVYRDTLAEVGKANNPTPLQIVYNDNVGLDECFMNIDHDPQYKHFLDNLRESGDSYLTEYNIADGIVMSIRYEGEAGSYERHESREKKNKKNRVARVREIQRTSRGLKRLKIENGRGDCIPKSRVTEGGPYDRGGWRYEGEDGSYYRHKSRVMENKKNRVVRDLEILRTSRAAKGLETKNGRENYTPKARAAKGGSYDRRGWRYEGEGGSYDKLESRATENKKNRVVRDPEIPGTSHAAKRSKTQNERDNCIPKSRVPESLCTSSTEWMARNRRSQQSKGDIFEVKTEKFDSCQRNSRSDSQPSVAVVSCQRNFSSDRQTSPEVLNPRACKSNTEKNCELEDENYMFYLRWLVDVEENSRINCDKGLVGKCETDTRSMSDPDVIKVGDDPFVDGEYTPFVPTKSYHVIDVDGENCGAVAISSSWFRKKLMDVLRKPFDETEFCELSSEVSVNKQVLRTMQLRDGTEYTIPSRILADSYLDSYPDFKKVYYPCRKDRHRALNLLRGFFLFIENIVHEDIFKPWLDAECLKTMLTNPGEIILT